MAASLNNSTSISTSTPVKTSGPGQSSASNCITKCQNNLHPSKLQQHPLTGDDISDTEDTLSYNSSIRSRPTSLAGSRKGIPPPPTVPPSSANAFAVPYVGESNSVSSRENSYTGECPPRSTGGSISHPLQLSGAKSDDTEGHSENEGDFMLSVPSPGKRQTQLSLEMLNSCADTASIRQSSYTNLHMGAVDKDDKKITACSIAVGFLLVAALLFSIALAFILWSRPPESQTDKATRNEHPIVTVTRMRYLNNAKTGYRQMASMAGHNDDDVITFNHVLVRDGKPLSRNTTGDQIWTWLRGSAVHIRTENELGEHRSEILCDMILQDGCLQSFTMHGVSTVNISVRAGGAGFSLIGVVAFGEPFQTRSPEPDTRAVI